MTHWPRGDYDYSSRLDEQRVLRELARASRWRVGPRMYTDDAGCERNHNHVAVARDTSFDAWALIFGAEFDSVPDRYRLDTWSRLSRHYIDIASDLNEQEHRHLRRAALAISHYAYVSDIRLDFGSIAGRWYLLAVLVTDDACD